MRLFKVLPALSLLFRARASSLESRDPVPHRLDVRDTSDVCGIINGAIPAARLSFSEECICLSTVAAWMARFSLTGQTIEDYLTGLIEAAAASSNCNYPAHSTPICSNVGDSNPCDFTCSDGFTPFPSNKPTACLCSAPNLVCNGQCVAQGACPSSQPVTLKKRSWVGSGSCRDMGPGWVACGVLGAGPRAWECVNAGRDLESCGGCTLPLTAYSPIGQDCTALPGVADVSCLGGECIVERCRPGYVLAFDGTSCIRRHHIPQSQFADPEDVPASAFGLEHVPHGKY